METPGNSHSIDDPLDQVLAEYLQAADSATPDQQAFIARYPQFAAELREFFASQERFEDAARPFRFEAMRRVSTSDSASAASLCGLARGEPTAGNQGLARGFARGAESATSASTRCWKRSPAAGWASCSRPSRCGLNRVVALKMILAGQLASAEDVKRFQVEAQNAAHLDHPNIVPVYEVGKHKGQHYFTMKLVDGSSLCGRAGEFAKDHRAAVALLTTVARAVDYAHQRGILHRDIKPGNILIDPSGQPQITDFGLARRD